MCWWCTAGSTGKAKGRRNGFKSSEVEARLRDCGDIKPPLRIWGKACIVKSIVTEGACRIGKFLEHLSSLVRVGYHLVYTLLRLVPTAIFNQQLWRVGEEGHGVKVGLGLGTAWAAGTVSLDFDPLNTM